MKHDELDEKELEQLESRLRKAVAGHKPEPPASLVDFIETVPAHGTARRNGAARRMGIAFGGVGLWHGFAAAAVSAAVLIAVAGTALLMSSGPDRGTAVASGTGSAPSAELGTPTHYVPASEWPWASEWPSESDWPATSGEPSPIEEPSGTGGPYPTPLLNRTISGRVTDQSGRPLAGMGVCAWNVQLGCEWHSTDGSGYYTLRVEAAHFVMWFRDESGAHASGFLGPDGFTYNMSAGRDIDVASASATGVDIVLPPSIHATLHLVNSSGTSLAGIYCWIHVNGFANWGTSDANGYCSVVVVPGQEVWFQFEDPSYVYASGYYSSSSPGGYTSYDGAPTRLTVPEAGLEVEVTLPTLPSASPSALPSASPSAPPSASPSASPSAN